MDVNFDGRASTANGRVRPMSSSSSIDDRWKKSDRARPKTSGSSHGSRENINSRPSSRPPSRQGSRGAADLDNARSNTVHGLGPIEAFTKNVRETKQRPATHNEGWAITQLNGDHDGMESKRRRKPKQKNKSGTMLYKPSNTCKQFGETHNK